MKLLGKKKSSKLRQPGVLPLFEHNFDKVSDNEIFACLFFEYGRESRVLVEKLSVFKKHFLKYPSPQEFEKYLADSYGDVSEKDRNLLQKIYYSPARVCLICPDFPKRAWQSVPAEQRKQGLKHLQAWNLKATLYLKKKMVSSEESGKGLLLKVGYSHFPIYNWQWNDDELADQFKIWLLLNRPISKNKTRSGRVLNPRDNLGYLKVLRYWRHFQGASREDLFEKIQMRETGMCRSKNKAKEFLKTTFGDIFSED